MNIKDIIMKKRDEILHITSMHGATNVRIFGSVARDEAASDSDIDFLVEFDSGRSLIDHVALIQDLEDLLGVEVDVVTESALHWYIKPRIPEEAIPL